MTTRRSILLAAPALAAIAALPAAAGSAEPDPVLEAVAEWRRLHAALERESDASPEVDYDELPSYSAERAALERACDLVPTTAEGLAAQVFFSFFILGDLDWHGDFENPDDFIFERWAEGFDGRVMRSMLAGARALAQA